MFLYKYHKNSFENIKTDIKIRIFPIAIADWLGFGVYKQNRENSYEIKMVRQSALNQQFILMTCFWTPLRKALES